jgi:CHAD domain-containing protein
MESDYVKLKDIKPALAGNIQEARSLLCFDKFPDEKAVHDIRVLMKKAKACLRLIAPQIDRDIADREIQSLRDIGRLMSKWRDTTVFRKILRDLRKRHPSVFSKLKGNVNILELLKKPDSVKETSEEIRSSLININEILNKTGYRIRFEPMKSLDPQLLLKELENSYNRVVNCYLLCRNSPKRANIHEFRKKSKDFLYQLWFFRPLNVPVVKSLEKKLDILAQNLGKYNDIAQLLIAIEYKYEYSLNDPALDEIAVILRNQQDRFLAKAWPAAYELFCPGQKLLNLLGFKFLVI